MKKLLFILSFVLLTTVNAQNLQETSKNITETVNTISSNTPKIAKSVKEASSKVIEETPGILAQGVQLAKDGVNTTVNAAKDATTFVDTSSNFRWMLNKTNDFVVATASALKVGAQQVLYIMAKKYFLMGIYAWVSVIFTISAIIFIYKKFGTLGADQMPIPMFAWIVIGGLVFFIHTQLPNAINYTFNPEYYVLEELKDFVVNIVK